MEPNTSSSFEKTITELINTSKPLRNSKLVELSDLNSDEAKSLDKVWATIELKRRRQIMNRLVELAEGNTELNFDVIFKSGLRDEDAEIRAKAIEGLWENEESSLIEPLIRLMDDTSTEVQEAATKALSKFSLLAALGKLRPYHTEKLAGSLFKVLEDKEKPIELRRRALEAVAPLELVKVQEAINDAYQSENNKLKISAVYAMGKNCNPSWLPVLLEELGSADSEMRYEAAGACGELGEVESVPSLIKLINDTDMEVRLAAIDALGKIGGLPAKNCLKRCLTNPSEVIRQAAEQALHQLEVEDNPLEIKMWDDDKEA